MAYSAVASLSHTIHLILSYHRDFISPQFNDEIISLQEHVVFLRSFLDDSPNRANNWEETIREVTNKAEDIIELLLSDSLLESIVGSSKSRFEKGNYEVRYSLDELEKVREEIESITDRVKGGRRIETAEGSDDELMEIISGLHAGSSSLQRIAIWGSGGMGKTTLARNAYNHPLIVEHFDIRAWATVSTSYVGRRIALDLMRSMNKLNSKSISDSEDELIESICKILGGTRYLIVLDDAWTPEALEGLKLMLPDNENGSRIIFTTRSLELAKSAGYIHEMSLLDDDQSWIILREKIFKGDPCPFQLESMGKMIARSCRGHPLSIEVVSGILLASDQTEAAWEDISENMKIASEDGDGFLQVLSLSYTYLPHHLRPCFLYLGIFPKDEIRVSKLIKLWVAEGFLNQSGYKSLEEMGEEYVENLVWRNLVSVSKRKSNGRIKSITIHDLMRDLCLEQARVDNFISNHVGKHWWRRRVSSSTFSDAVYSVYGSTIRTTVLSFEEGRQYKIRCLIGNVKLLRILDLSNAYNSDLPEDIFELFHLRYLAIHFRYCISEAISNLENLQTLVVYGRLYSPVKLFERICRMPQLRHLIFMSPLHFPHQNPMISIVENLQTLSGVRDFICSRMNLNMIPNVKKLNIFYTESYKDGVKDYEVHNLKYLQKLEFLKIEMKGSFGSLHMKNYVFPQTLKKLSLSNMQLHWKDMEIVSSLPNIQVLKLRNHACIGEKWVTSEGGFSHLTYLMIEESNLQHWITESSHFPRLKSLGLRKCMYLSEAQNNVGEISTLDLVEADYSNWSLLVSLKQIQEDRESLGNDPFKLVLCEEGGEGAGDSEGRQAAPVHQGLFLEILSSQIQFYFVIIKFN